MLFKQEPQAGPMREPALATQADLVSLPGLPTQLHQQLRPAQVLPSHPGGPGLGNTCPDGASR